MVPIDVEALRAQVRAMEYLRGTPDEVAQWHEDMAESCANLAIEDMVLSDNENAMFAMMLDEGLPPALIPSVILSLTGRTLPLPIWLTRHPNPPRKHFFMDRLGNNHRLVSIALYLSQLKNPSFVELIRNPFPHTSIFTLCTLGIAFVQTVGDNLSDPIMTVSAP